MTFDPTHRNIAGFADRGFLDAAGATVLVGSCQDCHALVAQPDQDDHVRWHIRSGTAGPKTLSRFSFAEVVYERSFSTSDIVTASREP